jgi:hypothetical protein
MRAGDQPFSTAIPTVALEETGRLTLKPTSGYRKEAGISEIPPGVTHDGR